MAPLTPLFAPGEFFADRTLDPAPALGVVFLLGVVLAGSVYASGWVLTERIDGQVAVDNPERPHEEYCRSFDDPDCEKPATVDRNVDGLVWTAVNRNLLRFVAVPFLDAFVLGILLEFGCRVADSEGTAFDTFVVAAWGLAPRVASTAANVAVTALTFDAITVTPATTPAALESQVVSSLAATTAIHDALFVAAAAWGAVVWFAGLYHARGLSLNGAAATAGFVALVDVLLRVA